MVIFVNTRSAYKEMKEFIFSTEHPVWLSDGVLSEDEIDSILENEVEMSIVDYAVDTSKPEELARAMSGILERYPEHNIWVQFES